MIKPFALH